ncbi:MAG: hypothetical protein AAGD35_11950 [Actinomycetota bacterium]
MSERLVALIVMSAASLGVGAGLPLAFRLLGVGLELVRGRWRPE